MFEHVTRLATVSSTNDVAATLPEGSVVAAEAQTAGRGRRGHTWFSPAGSGLYVSVVVAPSRAADPRRVTALLTLAAGVAIAEGIDEAAALRVDLKWPNDLYVGRRKLGGILAEASSATGGTAERVVVGYGVNVARSAYPPEVADRATALEAELGRPVDRETVLQASLRALARRWDDLVAGRFDDILDAWRARAPTASGARVTWLSGAGPIAGITDGIDVDGALRLRTAAGMERIVAGELVWELGRAEAES